MSDDRGVIGFAKFQKSGRVDFRVKRGGGGRKRSADIAFTLRGLPMFAGLVPIPERCPWSYIGGKFSNELTAELKKEIGPKYLLYPQRKALLVIAKCDANDDVLVANQHDCGKLFWVHLTWSGKLDDQHDIYPEVGTVRQADLVAFFKRYDQEPICENATFLRPE